MRQMLHIFKKDIRGLWGELAVFLGSLILACWSFPYGSAREGRFDLESSWAGEVMVLMAGCYLIARLIHAETIPGSRQFWLTRPYRWRALLSAKLLFIFLFVHLPVFVAQSALLRNADFPVWGNLPALLWMQILVLACVTLPAAAIAAVTRGLAGFALVIVGGTASTILLSTFLRVEGREWYEVAPSWVGFLWVPFAVLSLSLFLSALPTLISQYSARKTSFSGGLLGGIFLAGVVLSLFSGAGMRWTIQTLASTRPLDTESFQVALGTPSWMGAMVGGFPGDFPPASFERTQIDIQVPLIIRGVPPGIEIGTENVFLSFEAADGQSSRPDWVQTRMHYSLGERLRRTSGRDQSFVLMIRFADGKFYEKLRNNPSIVRGYVDLFAIGNERSLTVAKTSFPVNVTPAFRCGLENMRPGNPSSRDLKCGVAFRWPLQSIEVKNSPVGAYPFVRTESFSPFPANLRLNPILYRYPAFSLSDSPEVEFTLREPVSFARKEFEIHNVRLIEGPGTQRNGVRPQ